MSDLYEFLQEFSKVCIKYDMEISVNSNADLVVSKISNGEVIATDLHMFFYSRHINYTDSNDEDVDFVMED